MGQAASVPTDRTRKLEVIDAGFSRTGTLSYAYALETLLNGPVHHTATQLLNREDGYCKKWNQVYKYRREGNRPQLLKALADVFAGFVGATDVTAIDFIPELMELYPGVKIVLVTRNQAAWWKSFKTVADNAGSKVMGYILMPLPGARWFVDTARGFFEAAEDRTGRKCNPLWIEQHNEYVRTIVPKENLLEVELGSGWEPLSQYVGISSNGELSVEGGGSPGGLFFGHCERGFLADGYEIGDDVNAVVRRVGNDDGEEWEVVQ
ncbi:hypothetical protein TgHK011_004939 [Trichoderma gracile]|nr:hypothetical protein TgHK011_004939 [Trichoderma gracile]